VHVCVCMCVCVCVSVSVCVCVYVCVTHRGAAMLGTGTRRVRERQQGWRPAGVRRQRCLYHPTPTPSRRMHETCRGTRVRPCPCLQATHTRTSNAAVSASAWFAAMFRLYA
jgi:hypothetical protein